MIEISFLAILSNCANTYIFSFIINLKKLNYKFYEKHSMIGFDTKGGILYISQAINLDIYLTIASNNFLTSNISTYLPRYSTGSSIMSIRHYRQIITIIAHFLGKVSDRAYYTLDDLDDIDLDGASLNWKLFMNII